MKINNLKGRLNKIKLLVFDVDGVLTDGKINLIGENEEMKSFYCKDFPRLTTAMRSGLKIVLFTGRKGSAVIRRAKDLNADIIFKREIKERGVFFYDELKNLYGVTPSEVLYTGDDWNDLYLMKQAGVSVTPGNGSSENKKIAHIITKAKGGEGVAAETVEILMRARGTWDKYKNEYLKELMF